MSRKICIITGTRAEFGLLTPLIKRVQQEQGVQLQIIATGMHLSPEFGYTIQAIEDANIKVDKRIECLLSSDSSIAVNKAMGLAQISFAEAFSELKPDIIVVLGDRFEILSAAITAMIMNIPIAHLSGGELTYGAIDDTIRHALTKISNLHFVATEEFRERVIQMGENPNHVFNFGEAGLDNIVDLKLLNKVDFETSINRTLKNKNLLITYHPETRSQNNIESFRNILAALDELKDTLLIFTKANADEGGREINQMIDQYTTKNKNKAISFTSLGQLRYLSALQHVDAVVGNTSSGIVEAPSFRLATINIGNRQKGRLQGNNVINCSAIKNDILNAIQKLYSEEFQNKLKHITNPYGKGNSSAQTLKILKDFPLENLTNKTFFDLKK